MDRSTEVQRTIQEQDEILTEMDNALERLKTIANENNQVLTQQNRELDQLSEEINQAQGQMDSNLHKIKRVLERKSHTGGIIGVLSLIGLGLVTAIIVK